MLLAGCGPSPNDRICSTPEAVPAVGDWEGCVHRWSYRLARADGSLSQIASAAAGGCENAIEAAVEAGVPNGSKDLTYILDATTRRKAYASALFHAAQARAGHCAVP